jgi:hypothetical protein
MTPQVLFCKVTFNSVDLEESSPGPTGFSNGGRDAQVHACLDNNLLTHKKI